MIDWDDVKQYGTITTIVIALVFLIGSGIGFGILHYVLDQTETALLASNCVIADNSLVSSCQELYQLAIYPFLNIKDVLVWLSYFVIFGLILGMLMLGYNMGKSPWKIGFLVVVIIIMTYKGLEVSNMYRTLLENTIFQAMMIDFVIYNKVMLNLPWVVFITSLSSFALSIVNYQRAKVNLVSDVDELDY